MAVSSGIKSFGATVLGLAVMLGVLAIGLGLLLGAAAFSIWVLKWTIPVFSWTLIASIVVLMPLAFIPPTRGYAAIGFMIASTAFGSILWLWGMAYTYSVWGLLGIIVGLVMFGVGVVPVAFVAALVHGSWGNLGMFIFAGCLAFGFRMVATRLAEKADERTRTASEMTVDYR